MIKVSVIIPAYNVEQYIERCLTSVINQSLKQIEIIIINDGSTDSTLEFLENFSYLDNRIQIIDTKNCGVSVARNIGLLKSRGKYIFQIDGDDWIEKNTLEELYDVAEEKNADIVISNAYKDYDNGKLDTLIDGQSLSCDLLKELLTDNIIPCIWTKLYRRELFFQNNIKYSEKVRLGEDLLINFYLMFYAENFVKIEKSYTHYMQREDSVSNSYKEQVKDIYIVFEEMQRFLEENKIFDKYKQEFFYSKYLHTYYFRVVRSNKIGSIHSELYKNWKKEANYFKSNEYISDFLNKQKVHLKILEAMYRKNYYLGLLTNKLMQLVKRVLKK